MTLNTELTLLKLDRISGTGAGSYQFNFSFEVALSAPITVHAATDEDSEFWGLLTENIHYTVQLLVGGGKINISNQGMIDTLMANLLPGGNLAFNFLIIQRTVPFSQDTPMPLDYDASLTELSDDRIVRQTQQLDNRTNRLENVPGIFLPNGVVGQPNEAGRLLKIMVDGRNRFKGANLTDYDGDNAIHSLVDFYCNENIIVSKNATITGTTTAVGRITGSSAGFSGNLSVAGTATLAVIDGCALATIVEVRSTTITNSDSFTTNTATINAELTVIGAATMAAITATDISARSLTLTQNATIGGTLTTTGATALGSTLTVTGITTLNASLTVNNANLKVTGSGANDDSTSGIISAPRIESTYIMDVDGLLALNETMFYPEFTNAKIGDFLVLEVPIHVDAKFTLGSISAVDFTKIITTVSANRIAKGTDLTTGAALINSDMIESATDITIDNKTLTVAKGNISITAGQLTLSSPTAIFTLQSGMMKVLDKYITLRSDTFDDRHALYVVARDVAGVTHYDIVSAPAGGGGGGGGSTDVDADIIAKGDGLGNVVNSDISETIEDVKVATKSLIVTNGDLIADAGDIIMRGANAVFISKSGLQKIQDKHVNWDTTTFDGSKVLGLQKVMVGNQTTYQIVAVNQATGGGSTITAAMNRIVLSDGAGNGINSSIYEDAGTVNLDDSKALFAKEIHTHNFYIDKYHFYATTQDAHEIAIQLDSTLTGSMDVGASAPVNFKRIDTNHYAIIPMILAPTYPTFLPDGFFDNCIALWVGHSDVYTLKKVRSDSKIQIAGSTISEATVMQAQIDVMEGVVTRESPAAGALLIDPSITYMVFIEYDADITSINFTTQMLDSSNFTVLFRATRGGLNITFPSNWLFANGKAVHRSIDASWFVLDLTKNAAGDIFATYISHGYYPYGLTISLIAPYYDSGLAKFANVSGTLIAVDSVGKAYNATLAKWQFNTSLIDSTTYTTKTISSNAGVLNLLIDGSATIFYFTHNENITAINISINQDQAEQDFIIYLWRIPGTYTQATLPIPAGCYANMANITLKNGHAIIPMMWKKYNSTMTVLPGPAWNATY